MLVESVGGVGFVRVVAGWGWGLWGSVRDGAVVVSVREAGSVHKWA